MSHVLARGAHAFTGWRVTLTTVVERFPQRLRNRRFWVTQALVVGISAAHALLEATRHLGVLPDLALLPVSTYFIPVVYAALNFGVEGAVPTALWCALLTLPNVILWHTSSQRPGVLLQLALLVALAYVIARRVDVETESKERAQAAKARLSRLNLTAAASARTLDLQTVTADTVRALLDPDKAQTAWVLVAAAEGSPEVFSSYSTPSAPSDPSGAARAASRTLIDTDGSPDGAAIRESGMALVPLRVAGRVSGVAGLVTGQGPLSDDDLELLQAVGNQLSVALGNIRHFSQAQTMVSELSRAQATLQEYVRLATDAQEEERKRLARELHDDTIQTLAVAKAELDALTTGGQLEGAAEARLRNVQETLAATIDSVRRFSRDLRPSLLDDLGLLPAIEWLVGDLSARTGIRAQLRTNGPRRRLRPGEELALFRIVQEALHNVERHSGAGSVRVRIRFDRDTIRASVVDDGVGFEPADLAACDDLSQRLGLLGMRERAKLAGAQITISSRRHTGTRIAVTLASTVARDNTRSIKPY